MGKCINIIFPSQKRVCPWNIKQMLRIKLNIQLGTKHITILHFNCTIYCFYRKSFDFWCLIDLTYLLLSTKSHYFSFKSLQQFIHSTKTHEYQNFRLKNMKNPIFQMLQIQIHTRKAVKLHIAIVVLVWILYYKNHIDSIWFVK